MIQLPEQSTWAFPSLRDAYLDIFEVDEDDIENDTALELMSGLDLNRLPDPDFPHSEHHIQTVINYSEVMAKQVGLSGKWREKIRIAVKYHDITNGLVDIWKLNRKQHAFIASVFAYMVTGDKDVSDIVYFHDYDVIGEDFYSSDLAKAKNIIRDADQIALMGYSGLIRASYYWGFRDEEFFDSKLMEKAIVCDTRCDENGLPKDVDINARAFCFEKLFKFILNRPQLLYEVLKHSETNVERFFGKKNKAEKFLDCLIYEPDFLANYLKGEIVFSRWFEGNKYVIEPVNEAYSTLFINKILLDFEIINIARKLIASLEFEPLVDLREKLTEALQYEINKKTV